MIKKAPWSWTKKESTGSDLRDEDHVQESRMILSMMGTPEHEREGSSVSDHSVLTAVLIT